MVTVPVQSAVQQNQPSRTGTGYWKHPFGMPWLAVRPERSYANTPLPEIGCGALQSSDWAWAPATMAPAASNMLTRRFFTVLSFCAG